MRSLSGLIVVVGVTFAAALAFPHAQSTTSPAGPARFQQGPPAGGRGNFEPPAPKNLKVLPKEWDGRQVRALMQTFVISLGLQPPGGDGCAHCHSEDENAPPGRGGFKPLDYAADTKPAKDVARKMIQMVMAINADYLKDVGKADEGPEKVSCFTCHRGDSAKPPMQPDAGWGRRGGFSLLPAGPQIGGGAGQ
jgi:hypothetical protein